PLVREPLAAPVPLPDCELIPAHGTLQRQGPLAHEPRGRGPLPRPLPLAPLPSLTLLRSLRGGDRRQQGGRRIGVGHEPVGLALRLPRFDKGGVGGESSAKPKLRLLPMLLPQAGPKPLRCCQCTSLRGAVRCGSAPFFHLQR